VRQRQLKPPTKAVTKSKDAEDERPRQGQPKTERYLLQLDGQSKRSFATSDAAQSAKSSPVSPLCRSPFTTPKVDLARRSTDRYVDSRQ
jgi:hypothetical protein